MFCSVALLQGDYNKRKLPCFVLLPCCRVTTIKESYLVLFCCLAAGADHSKAYIDVKDAQWVCKGDLVPTDVNSLGPSHFVIYRFGVFLIRLLHHRSVQAAVRANQGIVAFWKALKSVTLWEIPDEQIHCPFCIVLGISFFFLFSKFCSL